ncbi:MAG: PDZ domain-containing protein [Gemmatimonadaceae bacterium]
MSRSDKLRVLAAAVAVSVAGASAAYAQKEKAPAGWVGLSVIQNGNVESGPDAKLSYPVVAAVDPGSPAKAAGLVAGDTILAYNDISANSDPLAMKRFLEPGTKLILKVRRNGVRNLTLTVAKRTDKNPFSQKFTMSATESNLMPLSVGTPTGPIAIGAPAARDGTAPFAGAYLARLNAGLANALNVKPSGVLVVDVESGTPAAKSGLMAGDVITRADSINVQSALGIMTAMRLAADRSITLSVTRHGKSQKLTVGW